MFWILVFLVCEGNNCTAYNDSKFQTKEDCLNTSYAVYKAKMISPICIPSSNVLHIKDIK